MKWCLRAARSDVGWLGVLVSMFLGCEPSAPSRKAGESIGHSSAAIVGGVRSDAAQDSVVLLAFAHPTGETGICTATLVAPRLLLTARHCVADTEEDVSCSATGAAQRGGKVRANHDAKALYAFTGPGRPTLDRATWRPAARGAEILDDGATTLCDHDLAFVVLEAPIEGVPPASLRLEAIAEQGEVVSTVGWGVTLTSNEPAERQQRGSVRVTRVGPDDSSPELTPSEFAFDESICVGDSGGPVFSSQTNAVVGVVSRGGNGRSQATSLSASCTKAVNLATKLAPFKDLVARAFARAGSEPVREVRDSDGDTPTCDVGHVGVRGPKKSVLSLFALLLAALAWARRRVSHANGARYE